MAESDDITQPSWLDTTFLAEALGSSEDTVVTGCEVKPAVARGENYLSCLHRVLVRYQTQERSCFSRSLIVKSVPAGEVVQLLCSELCAFAKERIMYEETLPAMERLLENSPPLSSISEESLPPAASEEALEQRQFTNKKDLQATQRSPDTSSSLAAKSLATFTKKTLVLQNSPPPSAKSFVTSNKKTLVLQNSPPPSAKSFITSTKKTLVLQNSPPPSAKSLAMSTEKTLVLGNSSSVSAKLLTLAKEDDLLLETVPVKQPILKDSPLLSARHFPVSRENTIVLEDLTSLGFRTAPRQSQLDLHHCLKAMQFIGKFHAASIVLHENSPQNIERFTEHLFVEQKREIAKYVLEPTLKTLAREVKKWPGYERFSDKIRNISNVGVHRLIDIFKPEKDSLSVLNHGDFWINNIMFKYHEGTSEIEEIRLVDFQISRYCSPVVDLIYFINTSPQEEVRLKYEDRLIQAYHTSLSSVLHRLGHAHKIVSLEKIRSEMQEKAFYGVIIACTIFCNVVADTDVAPDFSKLTIASLLNTEGENPMQQAFSGTLFRNQFQTLLLKFESEGLI